jgi:hypothetical protein
VSTINRQPGAEQRQPATEKAGCARLGSAGAAAPGTAI